MLNSKFISARMRLFAAVTVSLILSACGGGGSGSGTSQTGDDSFKGQAVKGVISNGIVSAYQINSDSNNKLLASTRTRPDGSFSFDSKLLSKATGDVVLIELSSDAQTLITCDVLPGCTNPNNGNYTDFGDTMPAPSEFRLLGTLNPRNPSQAFLSPLSHLVLSTATSLPGGLKSENISTATNWLKEDLGIKFDPLNMGIPDLTKTSSLAQASDAEILQGIYSASLFNESMRADWASFNFTLEDLDLPKLIKTSAQQAQALAEIYSDTAFNQQLNAAAQFSNTRADAIKGVDLSIIGQPQSVSAQVGENVIVRVSASGSNTLSYQWYRNGRALSGATNKQLNLNNISLNDIGLYSVDVSAGSLTKRSLSALVTVQEAQDKPSITQQPKHQSLSTGQGLLLNVEAIGPGPLRYTWQKGGSIIPGANSASLNIPYVNLSHAGTYRVTISNAYGITASQYASVVVTNSVAAVTITSQPSGQSVLAGNKATFKVSAQGGGFVSYQWRKDGQTLAGQNTANLQLDHVSVNDGGRYDVVISNSQGAVTSNSAVLNVVDYNIPLAITEHPQNQTMSIGDTVEFSVRASGLGALNYQWYKDGRQIAQAHGRKLIIRDATAADLGQYRVSISDGKRSVSSNNATLTSADITNINLTWDIPTAREDGSPLSMGEIKGYTLAYGYQANRLDQQRFIDGASTQQYQLSKLKAGTLYLRIATVDSDNITGSFSNTISVRIQP